MKKKNSRKNNFDNDSVTDGIVNNHSFTNDTDELKSIANKIRSDFHEKDEY